MALMSDECDRSGDHGTMARERVHILQQLSRFDDRSR